MQVHDELVFETSEKDLDKTSNMIIKTMMHAQEPIIKLNVPLEVSVGVGKIGNKLIDQNEKSENLVFLLAPTIPVKLIMR